MLRTVSVEKAPTQLWRGETSVRCAGAEAAWNERGPLGHLGTAGTGISAYKPNCAGLTPQALATPILLSTSSAPLGFTRWSSAGLVNRGQLLSSMLLQVSYTKQHTSAHGLLLEEMRSQDPLSTGMWKLFFPKTRGKPNFFLCWSSLPGILHLKFKFWST